MNWNWDHIRFFLALAEHGTLTNAARKLDVSHSTVLRRIRQLETQLNAHLFDHTNAGYSLTQAGQMLFTEASKMQSTMSALSREISGSDAHMDGEVVITTTDTIAKHILPDLLARLSEQFAGTRFSLFMVNSVSDMGDREADIAIRTGKAPPENLIGRKVAEIGFAAVASNAYIETHGLSSFPLNIAEHKVISLDDSYSAAPFYQWLHQHLNRQTSVTTVNNFLSAAALAGAGMGITVIPDYMLNTDSRLIKLDTREEISRNDLWVLSHTDSRNTKRVRVVCRFLYDELPKKLSQLT